MTFNLLAHGRELHVIVCSSVPEHPPVPGFPPLHILFLVLVPPPQVALQALYDDQSPHPRSNKNIFFTCRKGVYRVENNTYLVFFI